jgi:hypothetical protein
MRKLALIPVLTFASLVVLGACSDSSLYEPPPPPPPPVGSLELTIITTGEDIDADGYTASLDCGCFEKVEVNEIATMTDVEVGSHMVLLTSIAANCELDGPNPRWVNITAEETVRITFSIACTG